jgi:hypothetical protein
MASRTTAAKTLGVPAGRLLQLSIETRTPQPYVVTDSISITPPTKKRAELMRDAQLASMIGRGLLNQELTGQARDDVIEELSKRVKAAEDDYNKAFFGDAHDAVIAFFDDQPQSLWDAFVDDIRSDFLPVAPVDGVCPTCGHVEDDEAAGKAPESLT